MKFDTIESNLNGSHLQLLVSNSKDDSAIVEVTISEDRLQEMYPDEFAEIVKVKFFEFGWKATGGYISLQDWYQENMTKKRAWSIWESVMADETTLISNK
jgi:hypothetical protein